MDGGRIDIKEFLAIVNNQRLRCPFSQRAVAFLALLQPFLALREFLDETIEAPYQ